MFVGFLTNFVDRHPRLHDPPAHDPDAAGRPGDRRGYYGSDSAGTFVTCLGVLATAHIAYDAYMPVMLAVMEIPGCLVALYLVARLRTRGWMRWATCRTSRATTPTPAPIRPTWRVRGTIRRPSTRRASSPRRRWPSRRWSIRINGTATNGAEAAEHLQPASCSTRSSSTPGSTSSSAGSSSA